MKFLCVNFENSKSSALKLSYSDFMALKHLKIDMMSFNQDKNLYFV